MRPQDEKEASVLKDLTHIIEVTHSEGCYIFLFYSLRDILFILSSMPTGLPKADKQVEMTGTIGTTHHLVLFPQLTAFPSSLTSNSFFINR